MFSLLLMCAGSGTRVGLAKNKLLAKLNNKEVIKYTLEHFTDPRITEKILVVSKADLEEFKSFNLDCKLVVGGNSRSESVSLGLKEVTKPYVLIHDGARVLTSARIIDEHLRSLRDHNAVITLMKVADSVKNLKLEEVKRDELLLTQTPLSFKTDLILDAYHKCDDLAKYSDDFLIYKRVYGINNVHVVKGELLNFKLTTKEDLELLGKLVD